MNNGLTPDACECCNFETKELKPYETNRYFPKQPVETKWICKLCADTMTGAFSDYPNQHNADSLEIMKTICHVGNAILAELKKKA
ncbi:MAG TPA: hypothetical protein VHK27_01955 [Gammaproteobacteria bacterium]|nr:hypothetical protein [Gammaproteobacteria bacterium]